MRAKFHAALEKLAADPVESARAVGLRYVSDATCGFGRKRSGKNFKYLDAGGKTIRDTAILNRIKALAIPPAWSAVWICPIENGHLQASGRDARGRKQYRYHRRWREVRDETKYSHAIAFARALPRIRRRVARDLRRRGLPRQKVLATVVRLLEISLIRVGNDEYAQSNNSFGLTTMQDRHVRISGGRLRFQFRGKGGKLHSVDIEDRRLAKIVRNCQSIPGQELFQYIDDQGQPQDIGSIDVNDYLREISGGDFTAKDFRTWAGTVLAAMALREFEKFDSQAKARKNIVQAIEKVANRLGNTPAVCRKSYIHPAVFDAYLDGSMLKTLQKRAETELIDSLHSLRPEEASVLTLLQQKLTQPKRDADLKEQLVESLEHARRRKSLREKKPA